MNLLRNHPSIISIKFFVYILSGAFLTRYGSTLSWTAQILMPLLLWGSNVFDRHRLSIFKKMISWYAIFAVLVLFTAFFSPYGIKIPATRFVSIMLITLTIWMSFGELKSRKDIIDMLDGIVGAVAVIIIYLFVNNFNGYVFVLDLDEQNWGNRNTAGNYLFLGLVSSILRSYLSEDKRYFGLLSTFLLICVFLTTSMKCIVVGVFIYASYLFLIRKETQTIYKVIILAVILFATPYLGSFINTLLDTSDDMQTVADRLLILFGRSEMASRDYGFMTTRETLISQTIKLFYDNPIMGIGLENSREIYGTYSHNTYIEILAGGGIILFIPFLYFITITTLDLFKRSMQTTYLYFFCFLGIIYISNALRIYDSGIYMLLIFTLVYCKHYTPLIVNK